MGGEMAVELVAVIVGVIGVGVSYMQYKIARDDSRRKRGEQTVAAAETEQDSATSQPARLPVTRSHTAGLEAALALARGMGSSYERDVKRCEVFEEALRRKEYQFALQVVEEFENRYDRDRCREQLASKILTVRDPASVAGITESLNTLRAGKQ
ncbi:MAG: hypothetical protein OHK0029_27790 [Armatimonadaceae bacterium]